MGFGIKIEVSGTYACFTRPELKVERVSYDVITPSAARGLLEAILWKPAIKYVIDEIAVCEPIKFENIRRNEVDFIANTTSPKVATDGRAQRAAMLLKDVRYVISAHFEMTDKAESGDNEGKFAEMLRRRLEKGQHFHQPYLGTREFPANIRLIKDDDEVPLPIRETRSFGLMFYDFDFAQDGERFTPTYFMAEMQNGVIDLRNVEVLR